MRKPFLLPLDWQVVLRHDGWWLQRLTYNGTWFDFSGPYTQRIAAVRKAQRSPVGRPADNDDE